MAPMHPIARTPNILIAAYALISIVVGCRGPSLPAAVSDSGAPVLDGGAPSTEDGGRDATTSIPPEWFDDLYRPWLGTWGQWKLVGRRAVGASLQVGPCSSTSSNCTFHVRSMDCWRDADLKVWSDGTAEAFFVSGDGNCGVELRIEGRAGHPAILADWSGGRVRMPRSNAATLSPPLQDSPFTR